LSNNSASYALPDALWIARYDHDLRWRWPASPPPVRRPTSGRKQFRAYVTRPMYGVTLIIDATTSTPLV